MRRLGRHKLLALLAVIGPGVITSAADNDAAGIITYAQAGAKYRFDLLWVIVLITFVLAMVQEMSARMGTITQKGLGELIRENFGVKWAMFALGTLFVANLGVTVADFAGIAMSLEIFGLPRYITVPTAALVIWLLVVRGSFRVVEKAFMAIMVLYATYIVSGFMARPDWGEVFRSVYSPNLGSLHTRPDFLFLTIAVIGTTITPWMQFFLQATVVDKGVRVEDYPYEKLDVFVGSFLTDLVSFFIIISTAVMIYDANGGPVPIQNAAEAAAALRPAAHGYAEKLFALGLLGASLLGAAVVPLSTAYSYCEAFGWEIGISRRFHEAPTFYSIYTLCILVGVVVVLLPSVHLVNTMIGAQGVNGILLPVILVFMLKLVNSRDVMNGYVNSRTYNVVVWLTAVVLIAMTLAWLVGTLLGY
ncbi:MAG: divalent metal cation transporter [Armatimonadota bacterium]|nr:divalent metal cation transporter [Armatimonadota bacterium]